MVATADTGGSVFGSVTFASKDRGEVAEWLEVVARQEERCYNLVSRKVTERM
jgi:orotate phosphoribosyltransferase